jgi:hypothetical protein
MDFATDSSEQVQLHGSSHVHIPEPGIAPARDWRVSSSLANISSLKHGTRTTNCETAQVIHKKQIKRDDFH